MSKYFPSKQHEPYQQLVDAPSARLPTSDHEVQRGRYSLPYSSPYAAASSYELEPQPTPFRGDKAVWEEANIQRLGVKRKFRDPVFFVLFVLQLLAFTFFSIVAIVGWTQSGGFDALKDDLNGNDRLFDSKYKVEDVLNKKTAQLVAAVSGAALILTAIYLVFLRLFTRFVIEVTLLGSVLVNVAAAIFFWTRKPLPMASAITFSVLAIFMAIYYFLIRSRILLAKVLLQVTMDVTKHSPSVYFVVLGSLVTQTIFSLWFVVTIAATFVRFSPSTPFCARATFLSSLKCSNGTTIGLIAFEVFSFLWSSTTLSAVTLATLAGGPFGTWYYYGPRQKGRTPSHPTIKAFFRAITLNLGSLALGSLIVTILETICAILRGIMRSAAEDGNVIACILACCIGCCVEWFTALVECFNKYAYISVSLYGGSYFSSAKQTWQLFKRRGVDAIVNDSIVGTALGFGALLVAVGSGAVGFAFIKLTKPAYHDDASWTGIIVLFSALIGLQAGTTLGSAIEAGVSTIFVGLAENPQVLAERSPRLFELVRNAYPTVMSVV